MGLSAGASGRIPGTPKRGSSIATMETSARLLHYRRQFKEDAA